MEAGQRQNHRSSPVRGLLLEFFTASKKGDKYDAQAIREAVRERGHVVALNYLRKQLRILHEEGLLFIRDFPTLAGGRRRFWGLETDASTKAGVRK